MNKDSKILITGSNGFVGKNLVHELKSTGYANFHYATNVDLRKDSDVESLFKQGNFEYVFSLAAKVGGIAKNISDPFGFLIDNLRIQNNVIENSIKYKVKKVLNLGSSCIYPKDFPLQPLKEEYLLDGKLEPTNEGYSLAKICGLKLCEYANKQQSDTKFISLMPCNLYGPEDKFDLKTSHALAALISKTWNASQTGEEEIEVWGSGLARREWMFVEDLVDCMIWSMNNLEKTETFLNVGTGIDISMNELAEEIFYAFYSALDNRSFLDLKIKNDTSKPDGMLKKCLDVSKINSLGWKANHRLEQGLEKTIQWFLENKVLW